MTHLSSKAMEKHVNWLMPRTLRLVREAATHARDAFLTLRKDRLLLPASSAQESNEGYKDQVISTKPYVD